MIGIIFVNRKNIVDTYQINIDARRIKYIQKSIDNYNGKERIETTSGIGFFVDNSDFFGKKIEILSKKYVGKEQHFNYCCAEVDNIDIYKYKYYAYTPHKLSQLCDNLLKSTDSLNLSYCIHDILNYECETGIEQDFLKKIINSIKFKKINNVNFLIKIRNELKRLILQKDSTQLCINFNNVVEQKIHSMQIFNEAFHSQELSGQPLKYSTSQKRYIKEKILVELPTEEKLKIV